MALIKTEKLECDICGSCRGVFTFLFKITKIIIGEGIEQAPAEVDEKKDLCPACLKRAMKFHARGLSKSQKSETVGADAAAS